MREILFRGKRTDNGEWIKGNVLQTDDGECYIATSCLIGTSDEPLMVAAYKVDTESICQFIGLMDKNGKQIWENDIVRIGANTLVRWNEKYAGWCLTQRGWMYEHFFGEAIDNLDCEVVGNIFDNPELMKK